MRTVSPGRAIVLLALATISCRQAQTPTTASTPPEAAGDRPFVLTGVVRESGSRAPVPDVNVCWYDEICARTNQDGSYRLDGPHKSGGYIDQCPFVYGDDFEIRQNCLTFTYPESPWSPTVQRAIRIEAGETVAATIFADDISGLQGEDYCSACKRIRVRAPRAGWVTVRIAPETGYRVTFGYVDQRLNEPFAVQAGQDSPIIISSDSPSGLRSFELSTTFVPK